MDKLFTIGHSTHSAGRLIELLGQHSINAVADVRSSPYSSYNPQFNRELLQKELENAHIEYVYMGKELGARSNDPGCYKDGTVQFDLVAQTSLFQKGLSRLKKGIQSYRIALLCAEKDPVSCHRTMLICRNIRSEELTIQHILEDGTIENNSDMEIRLMKTLNISETDLFMSTEELINKAYDIQGKKIAYTEKPEE